MATLITTDGLQREVKPKNGKDFKLEELYELIKCESIDIIDLHNHDNTALTGEIMVIDDMAKVDFVNEELIPKQHTCNIVATRIADTTLIKGDYIAGNALVCKSSEVL